MRVRIDEQAGVGLPSRFGSSATEVGIGRVAVGPRRFLRAIGLRAGFAVVAALAGVGAAPGTASAQELMGTRVVTADGLRVAQGAEGTIRTYFDAPTSTLLNLGLRSSTLQPGETPHPTRPHSRITESLILVEAGSLEVTLDSETRSVQAGTAVLLGPNQWHSIRNAGNVPVTFYEIAWTSPGMNGEPDYPEEAVNWRRR